MQSNISLKEVEIQVENKLFKNGYLPGLIKCSCGANYFKIQQDSSNHTSLCAFSCPNRKCRRKFPIRINSFYASFYYIPLTVVSKVIYCFLCNQA